MTALRQLLWRRLRRSVGSDLVQRVLHTVSDAVATVPTRGRPVYGAGDLHRAGDTMAGVVVPAGLYHTIEGVAVAALAAPASGDAPNRPHAVDLIHANAIGLVWRHAADANQVDGTIEVTVWVHSGLGWVRSADATAVPLAPRQELRVETACRPVYVQLANPAGVAGDVNIYLGGEA